MRLQYPLDVAESPGQGIRGRVNGSAVAVGSHAFLRGRGIDVPAGGRPRSAEVQDAMDDRYAGRMTSPTACDPMLRA